MKWHTLRLLGLALLVALFASACDHPILPWVDEEEVGEENWLEGFEPQNPGQVEATNDSSESLAIFDGRPIEEERLVGVLGGHESGYALDELHGETTLNAVRKSELEESLDAPEDVEVVWSEWLYVHGDDTQRVHFRLEDVGDAALTIINRSDYHVQVLLGSYEGQVLGSVGAQQQHTVYYDEGAVELYPMAIEPIRDNGEIVDIRRTQIGEPDAVQLDADEERRFTIEDSDPGDTLDGYVRVVNNYDAGLRLYQGDTLQYTVLDHEVVGSGGRGDYPFLVGDSEEERMVANLELVSTTDDYEVTKEVPVKRGKVTELTIAGERGEGEISIGDPKERELID